MYKSTDAGKTWTHVGLANAGQIGAIRVLKIRSEGKHNKRVEIALAQEPVGQAPVPGA